MIAVAPINPHNLALFKDARLRALQDTPTAFGATYAQESLLTDADWLNRVTRWSGDRGVGFLAIDDRTACGIVGSFLQENDPRRAKLISMWVAPAYRQQGIGRLLVDEILAWARLRRARALDLLVTSVNDPAIRFYERLGFARTGHTQPYPNDPAILEYEMSLAIP